MSDRKVNFFSEEPISRRKLVLLAPGLLLIAACQKTPRANWDISFEKPGVFASGLYKLVIDGGYFAKQPYYHHDYKQGDFRLNFLAQPQGSNLKLDVELGHPNQSTFQDAWTAVLPNPNLNIFHMFMTKWSNWKFTEWGFDVGRYSLPVPTQTPPRRSI